MDFCLITGGAGFIGSNLARGLLKKGYKVRILDNLSTGNLSNIEDIIDDVEFINADIRDSDKVNDACKGISYVFHHAALSSVQLSIDNPILSHDVNVSGSLNVLHAGVKNKVKKVIIASSSSVYGDSPELPKDETMMPNPLSPYAVCKLTVENYAKVFSELYDIDMICLRYFNVFGPYQDPNSQYSAVIPLFIKAMLENVPPVIYGNGEQSRDFVYIENIINANILAIENNYTENRIFNVGGLVQVSINDLVNKINNVLLTNIKPIYQAPRKGDIIHSYANIELISKELNYTPLVSFDNGLRSTVNFYRDKI